MRAYMRERSLAFLCPAWVERSAAAGQGAPYAKVRGVTAGRFRQR